MRTLTLQIEREIMPPIIPKLMRKPVYDERMKSLEVKQRLQIAVAGWVAIEYGGQIRPEDLAEMAVS
jgi:hypothetical protein